MTKNTTDHPAQVPPDRLVAAKEKATLRPAYDSGRGRFNAEGPRALEPRSAFLRQIIFDTTAPCDGLTGTAYRAEGFDDSGSIEFRCWIFVPDAEDSAPEVGYYCCRINILVAQDCTHAKFLAGDYPGTDKCPECEGDGKIYPHNFQEELRVARAAEAARNEALRKAPERKIL